MSKLTDYKNLWIEKYRPETLDDLVLEPKVKADILKWAENDEIPHLLFYGDAGGGKTTLAKVIADDVLDCQYLYINGSEQSGVDVVRGLIRDFSERKSIDGKLKVIIIDECEGMSSVGGSGSSAQQAMRNVMEEYSHLTRFILTSNYLNKIIDPIESRCIAYHIIPPIKPFVLRCVHILDEEKVEYDKSEIIEYTKQYYPDLRKAVNAMQRDTVDGKLVITKKSSKKPKKIVSDLFDHIGAKKDTHKLREMMIQNGSDFSNDYRQLMSDMFNYVYESKLSDDIKRKYMIELSSGLHKHELVMDKEINAYSTLLRMY